MSQNFDSLSPENSPLNGIRVLDFSQFLAGPVAAMKLADFGADVIKIERPQGGDACRGLVINDQKVGDSSLLFHTFNRGKRSFSANLKSEDDLKAVKQLIQTADVMIHNFRPGIMDRVGLDYETVSKINPKLIYGVVSGYGNHGPWAKKPGQDLLVQSLSGMTWLNGNADSPPVPSGFPLVDISTANNLIQGILLQLIKRGNNQKGGLVEVDMISTAVDLQIEHLTAFFNDNNQLPERSEIANANVYGAAPYGIFTVKGGYIAIAMTPLKSLADLLSIPALNNYKQDQAFSARNEIKAILAESIADQNIDDLLNTLESADIWCAKVMDWKEFSQHEGFHALDLMHQVSTKEGQCLKTTRNPIRLDGHVMTSPVSAPSLGADNQEILNELKP